MLTGEAVHRLNISNCVRPLDDDTPEALEARGVSACHCVQLPVTGIQYRALSPVGLGLDSRHEDALRTIGRDTEPSVGWLFACPIERARNLSNSTRDG
jgi:hypothetical protein